MILTKYGFEKALKAWEEAYLATCDGDDATFPEAERTMNVVIDALGFKDAEEKDSFLSLVETFKDTGDVMDMARKIFERNYKKLIAPLSVPNLFDYCKNFNKQRTDLLKRIQDFKESYNSLKETLYEDIAFDTNSVICDNYPFDKSFDEHNVDDWIDTIRENLTNLAIIKFEKIENSLKSKKTYSINETLLDDFASLLNNSMEEDSDYWESELGCDADEIVDYYGFGYETNEKKLEMAEVDDLVPVKITEKNISELYSFFKDRPIEDRRYLIHWIRTIAD
jgi:hypothetical protein